MNTSSPRRRWLLIITYALFAVAGATAWVWPSVAVAEVGVILARIWAVFLVTGGIISLVGSLRQTWVGEFVGLPLLITVFTVYGTAALSAAIARDDPTRTAGAMTLFAFAFLLTYRMSHVADLRKAAREGAVRRQCTGGA